MIRFFRHYIPVSMLVLTLAEFVLFVAIGFFIAEHYAHAQAAAAHATVYKPWLFALVLSLIHSAAGLYDWEWTKGLNSLLLRIAGGLLVA
ncbi:MAG: hypothetical protein MUE86_03185, partial [Thiobacillaceae bacterium]|nr:hypothetical protein [Thiobacillaceae bacterium]